MTQEQDAKATVEENETGFVFGVICSTKSL